MPPCAVCHYELEGQPTFYVEQYHLIAVRCPECGREQPADPSLAPARTRQRLAHAARILRLPAACTLALALAASLAGIAQSAAYVGTEYIASALRTHYIAISNRGRYPRSGIARDWWAQHEPSFRQTTRGSYDGIIWDGAPEWAWYILAIPLPTLILCNLLKTSGTRTRRWLLLAPVPLAAIALLCYFAIQPIHYAGYGYHHQELATDEYAQPMAWGSLLLGTLLYAVSVRIALPITARHHARRPDAPQSSDPTPA